QAVENFFELPVLAGIPRPTRRQTAAGDAAQREAYGLLAANLRFATLSRASNVLMVTSPGPGDGKTSVTLGTARALAQLGLRVIAIEADLRRPTFGRYVTLGSSVGLTGILGGEHTLAEELVWLDVMTFEAASGNGQG